MSRIVIDLTQESPTPPLGNHRNPRSRNNRPRQNRVQDDDDDVSIVRITQASPRSRPQNQSSTNRQSWHETFLNPHVPPQQSRAVPPNVRIHDQLNSGPHSANPRFSFGFSTFSFLGRSAFPWLLSARPPETFDRTDIPPGTYMVDFDQRQEEEIDENLMRYLVQSFNQEHPRPISMPKQSDPTVTHLTPSEATFCYDIIEPPLDLDTYFDDKAIVTGPLPDTTPICCLCEHALVKGGTGPKKIWALPCGHVLDGSCVSWLSGGPRSEEDGQGEEGLERNKGKGKANDQPHQGRPPAKSTRSRTGKVPTKPLSPFQSKQFLCPVPDCKQMCATEPGSKFACFELFV